MTSLSQLKSYLQSHPSVTLNTLQTIFNEPLDTLQTLLNFFIQRGNLSTRQLTSQCGKTCQQCRFANTVVYQWSDR